MARTPDFILGKTWKFGSNSEMSVLVEKKTKKVSVGMEVGGCGWGRVHGFLGMKGEMMALVFKVIAGVILKEWLMSLATIMGLSSKAQEDAKYWVYLRTFLLKDEHAFLSVGGKEEERTVK